jgi:hypothetical protein
LSFYGKLKAGLTAAATFLLLQAPIALNAREQISEAMAREMLTVALKNLDRLKCSEEKLCAAATEDEFRHPPVSIEDARRAMSV